MRSAWANAAYQLGCELKSNEQLQNSRPRVKKYGNRKCGEVSTVVGDSIRLLYMSPNPINEQIPPLMLGLAKRHSQSRNAKFEEAARLGIVYS